jgi:hypothetical protein
MHYFTGSKPVWDTISLLVNVHVLMAFVYFPHNLMHQGGRNFFVVFGNSHW